MNYRELQQQLKAFKAQGLTTVKLNSKKEVLEAEYRRIIDNKQNKDELVSEKEIEANDVAEVISWCIDDCLIAAYILTGNDFTYLHNRVYDRKDDHVFPYIKSDFHQIEDVEKRLSRVMDNHKGLDKDISYKLSLDLMTECNLHTLRSAIENILDYEPVTTISNNDVYVNSIKGIGPLKRYRWGKQYGKKQCA